MQFPLEYEASARTPEEYSPWFPFIEFGCYARLCRVGCATFIQESPMLRDYGFDPFDLGEVTAPTEGFISEFNQVFGTEFSMDFFVGR